MAASYFDPQAGSRELRRKAHAEFSRRLNPAPAKTRGGHKCGSCGSGEYAEHRGASICSYCRTPEVSARAQDQAPVKRRYPVERELQRYKIEARICLEDYLNARAAIIRASK